MTLILDAGAFVALERNDRAMWRRLKAAKLAGTPPRTHGGVIAQVWRGGAGPQAPLARAVKSLKKPRPGRAKRRRPVLTAWWAGGEGTAEVGLDRSAGDDDT